MRRKSTGQGFTLVELLVVIAIIGILVALLLPAIQAAREAARRTQCNNNLKNIALGLQNYHDTYKMFPAGAIGRRWLEPGPESPTGALPTNMRLGPSWYYATLPYMEQRNIYDKIQSTQKPGQTGVEFRYGSFPTSGVGLEIRAALEKLVPDYMRCPSSPLPVMNEQTGNICNATYTGISGGTDISNDSTLYPTSFPGVAPPTHTQVYLNNQGSRLQACGGSSDGGMWTSSGMLPPCENIDMAKCTDGTSNTMIVAEQSDYLQNVDPTISSKYRGDPGWSGAIGTHRGWLSGTDSRRNLTRTAEQAANRTADTFNINTVRYKPNLKRVLDGTDINGGGSSLPGCAENRRGGRGANNPIQSPHPGGVLVGMVDGSVQFVSGTTDLGVFLRLAIREDGQNVKLD